MELTEALQKYKNRPKPNPYIQISTGYSKYLILPHKEGMMFMEAMRSAEEYEHNYSGPPKIRPLPSTSLTITFLSEEEYQRIHMAQLMGVSISDLDPMPF